MNLTQQLQTESIVDKLGELGHPIEDVFSSINDFENPTKEIVAIYTDVYRNNYDKNTIYDIGQVLSNILLIRGQLLEDMEGLGFEFNENLFYKGLMNFSLFLEHLFNNMYEEVEEEETKKDIYNKIKQGEMERKINDLIDMSFSKMQELLFLDLPHPELEHKAQRLFDRLNSFFIQYGVYYKQKIVKLGIIDTETNYKLYRFENTELHYKYNGETFQILNNKKISFIGSFIQYVRDKKKFDEDFEKYRPTNEMIQNLVIDKLIYGAKSAYGRFLKAFLERQREIKNPSNEEEGSRDFLNYKILPSIEVSVDLYKRWKNKENIQEELRRLYEKSMELITGNIDTLPYGCDSLIIRSSAVFSEDNDLTSGAGIYKSVKKVKSFEDFENAVDEVFGSVDSTGAIEHRNKYGIKEEFMGLKIEPYVVPVDREIGYMNSTRPHLKHLMDYRNNLGFQITFDNRYLPMDLINVEADLRHFISLHFNIDFWSYKYPENNINDLVKMLYVFGKYLKKELQIEFVSHNYSVQLRPIVSSSTLEKKVIFPDSSAIYEGRSILAGDIIAKPDEILIIDNSYRASLEKSNIRNVESGKIKLVIIKNSFSASNGHIETICAENGVMCIIGDPLKDCSSDIPTGVSLRGVCDGDVGRVYLV